MTRRAPRLDANHTECVEAFRNHGISVCSLAGMADGVPDLLIAYDDCCWLVEIKDGSKPPSRRKLTPPEEKFFLEWPGRCVVVYSTEDAKQIANAIKRQARALAKVEAAE